MSRCWEDVTPGEPLPPLAFPLPMMRLVMAVGANRDFNSIHHNGNYARSTGAPDFYANTTFLLGMWERSLRGFIGSDGTIRSISGFRMRGFNVVGDTVMVYGEVERMWEEAGVGVAAIRMWSVNGGGVSVGPGVAVVTMVRRAWSAPSPCGEGQ